MAYQKKKVDRDDERILKEIFDSSYDNNQIKIIQLLQEMNSTSEEIRKSIIELKKTAKYINTPDKLKG